MMKNKIKKGLITLALVNNLSLGYTNSIDIERSLDFSKKGIEYLSGLGRDVDLSKEGLKKLSLENRGIIEEKLENKLKGNYVSSVLNKKKAIEGFVDNIKQNLEVIKEVKEDLSNLNLNKEKDNFIKRFEYGKNIIKELNGFNYSVGLLKNRNHKDPLNKIIAEYVPNEMKKPLVQLELTGKPGELSNGLIKGNLFSNEDNKEKIGFSLDYLVKKSLDNQNKDENIVGFEAMFSPSVLYLEDFLNKDFSQGIFLKVRGYSLEQDNQKSRFLEPSLNYHKKGKLGNNVDYLIESSIRGNYNSRENRIIKGDLSIILNDWLRFYTSINEEGNFYGELGGSIRY